MFYKFLGTALKDGVDIVNGKWTIAYGKTVVEQSINRLLRTPIGERFFLREYGSRLDELLFQPNDQVLNSLLRQFIRESIDTWEGRAKFVDLQIHTTDDPQKLTCVVEYKLLPSNEINSFVFPFFKELIY